MLSTILMHFFSASTCSINNNSDNEEDGRLALVSFVAPCLEVHDVTLGLDPQLPHVCLSEQQQSLPCDVVLLEQLGIQLHARCSVSWGRQQQSTTFHTPRSQTTTSTTQRVNALETSCDILVVMTLNAQSSDAQTWSGLDLLHPEILQAQRWGHILAL